MVIELNGQSKTLDSPTSISDLLAQLNLEAAHVIAELNRTILTADQFGATILQQGDRLELIQFVGGG
ncbi:MAG: thiamine biosynthesis protein ThiS [Desulfuromonas sp.]|nr:MAG: thiamine biosynthesis protein ThiS [Desulfuromonas sp.]